MDQDGYLTKFFALERGIRQGCPLSCYLFLIVAETLASKIRNSSNIQGIQLKNKNLKISQMADDTCLFLKDNDSIRESLNILEDFHMVSGLKTNIEKTKAYNIGQNKNGIHEDDFNLAWDDGDIRLLGLTVTENIDIHLKENVNPKIITMQNLFKVWKQRKLTLKGRITVINSLIIPLFIYPATILSLPESTLQSIEKQLYDFLWEGLKPKIAKATIEATIEEGGLKMSNIKLKMKAWQLSWLKRAVLFPDLPFVHILNEIIVDMDFNDLIKCRLDKKNIMLKRLPQFYAEILCQWNSLREDYDIEKLEGKHILEEFLWHNKCITIEKQPFLWKSWYNSGVKYVHDLLDENGNFLSAEELSYKYDLNVTFLQALQLRKALPFIWRQKLKSIEVPKTFFPQISVYCNVTTSVRNFTSMLSKEIYWMLWKHQRKKKTPAALLKWNEIYQIQNEDWQHIFKAAFLSCTSTFFQSFQYKVLHRIIACRHWLYNLRVIDSPNCLYCGKDDTIVHFFYHCPILRQFWTSFCLWWSRLTNSVTSDNFHDITVIFGGKIDCDEAISFNYCLTIAKYYIYINRLNEIPTIDFYKYLVFLKSKLNEEYMYYEEKDNLKIFTKSKGLIFENI